MGTSVTVALMGAETFNAATRPGILIVAHHYEIKLSHNRGNGMLVIYIHNMKDATPARLTTIQEKKINSIEIERPVSAEESC